MSIEGPIRTVQNGLVLHLDAGNNKSYPGTGATWFDLCGNTNASLVASPTFASTFCGEFILNGSSQNASVSSVYNFATSNKMTAIVWAKSAVENWNNFGFIISRRDQFIIHPNSGTRDINCYFNTNLGWQAVSYTPSIITVYAQYAMSYDAGTVNAYHNGVRTTGGSLGATLTSDTGVVEIGKDDLITARYLNGSIASVQLYNRALSPNEILQNYNAAKSRFGL